MAASLGAFICYFTAALLHGALFTLMLVIVQYLYMLPTYVNMFSIFSFCNMHDISWGTKEGTSTRAVRKTTDKGTRSCRIPWSSTMLGILLSFFVPTVLAALVNLSVRLGVCVTVRLCACVFVCRYQVTWPVKRSRSSERRFHETTRTKTAASRRPRPQQRRM